MKKLTITAFILGALVLGFPAPPAEAQVSVRVSIGGFYRELAPHGRWVSCRYGQCWVPRRVSRRWQPYSYGRWVYTDYGWTWVSRDPWGSTPYHYGSWTYLRGYGWSWVPGTVWAPAWVTWSYSDRYVGWAPLPPSFACGDRGYSGRAVVLSASQYVFVPTNRFVDTEVDSIWLPITQNAAVFRSTRPVTSFAVSDGAYQNVGVPIATVQSAVGSRIETRNISAANTAPEPVAAGGGGKGRRMSIVAPAREVNAAVAAGPRESAGPAPSKAEKAPKGREASPAQARGPARETAPVQQRQSKAQKSREAPPVQAREAAPMEQRQPKAPKPQKVREAPPVQAREAAPVEQRQPKAPKEPKGREVPPGQPQRQAPQAAPMEQRQPKPPKEPKGREAPPAQPQAAQPAPAPPGQAAPPKPEPAKEKPAKPEKEKKEKDNKDH